MSKLKLYYRSFMRLYSLGEWKHSRNVKVRTHEEWKREEDIRAAIGHAKDVLLAIFAVAGMYIFVVLMMVM